MGLVVYKTNIEGLPFIAVPDNVEVGEGVYGAPEGIGFQPTYYFVLMGVDKDTNTVSLKKMRWREAKIYKPGDSEPFLGGILDAR
jgi:hypothetical protein